MLEYFPVNLLGRDPPSKMISVKSEGVGWDL